MGTPVIVLQPGRQTQWTLQNKCAGWSWHELSSLFYFKTDSVSNWKAQLFSSTWTKDTHHLLRFLSHVLWLFFPLVCSTQNWKYLHRFPAPARWELELNHLAAPPSQLEHRAVGKHWITVHEIAKSSEWRAQKAHTWNKQDRRHTLKIPALFQAILSIVSPKTLMWSIPRLLTPQTTGDLKWDKWLCFHCLQEANDRQNQCDINWSAALRLSSSRFSHL